MDRKKSYLKIVISFIFFTVYFRNHVPELSYNFKGLFKGAYGRKFAFKDPIGLQCVREGILCQHFFDSHFNGPFARWRHFITTTGILQVFPFILNFRDPSEV